MSIVVIRRQRGVTLVELMVAIVIASLLAIAVSTVLAGFEGRKRATTSVNDLNQSGNYAAWVIDNLVRSAGSGYAQTAEFSFGCKLYAARSGAASSATSSSASSSASALLGNATSVPAPFSGYDAFSEGFRLAPVLIAKDATTPGNSGAGSDVLVVMSGAAGKAEAPGYLSAYPTAGALSLKHTLQFSANDLVLLADQEAGSSGLAPCMFSQVSSTFSQSGGTSVALEGAYYAASVDSIALTGFTKDAVAMVMGNVSNANPPAFNLIGVGNSGTLYAYDLLQATSSNVQAIAQGVFEMHALYGLDTDSDGRLDTWAKPEGDYAYSALTAGTSAAASTISSIKAIRVGLILRTDLLEKNAVSPASITLFSDLEGMSYSPSIAGDNARYRYRTVEITVPLRNTMLLEGS